MLVVVGRLSRVCHDAGCKRLVAACAGHTVRLDVAPVKSVDEHDIFN